MVEIDRDGLGQAGNDVDQGNRIGSAAQGGDVGERTADTASADDHEPAEPVCPRSRRSPGRGPTRIAAIEATVKCRRPGDHRTGRHLQGPRPKSHLQACGGLPSLLRDNCAWWHFDVPATPPARPLNMLGTDDRPAVHDRTRPSTSASAAVAASMAASTDASAPDMKNRPNRPTARTCAISISAAFSASLMARLM